MQTSFTRLLSVAAGIVCFAPQIAVAATVVLVPPPPPPPLPADISLDLARQAVEAAIATCSSLGDRVVAEVVDREGNAKVLMIADGAQRGLLETARKGAHTVLTKGMSSGEYGRSFYVDNGKPYPFNLDVWAGNAALKADPDLWMNPGAVPIRKGGVIVGAVSVAGTRLIPRNGGQEPCAIAGRDKIEAAFRDQTPN